MGKLRAPQIDTGTGANQIVQLNGSSQLPAVDGSLLTSVSTDTGLLLASKTSDEIVTNSTVLQDDDELFVTIPGPGFYIINLLMVSDGPVASAGIDFLFNYADTISSSLLTKSADPSYGGFTIDSGGNFTIGTTGVGVFDATLLVGSATFLNSGLFKLQWAQNTADVVGTTLFTGSYLSLQKV